MFRNSILQKILFLIVIISLFSLVGCEADEYKLLHDKTDVSSVQIVEIVSTLNETQRNVLLDISDMDTFLTDFNQLQFERYLVGDPAKLTDGRAIKISYVNGDCEYIEYCAQEKIVDGASNFGVYYCDQDDFNNLMDKYLDI